MIFYVIYWYKKFNFVIKYKLLKTIYFVYTYIRIK